MHSALTACDQTGGAGCPTELLNLVSTGAHERWRLLSEMMTSCGQTAQQDSVQFARQQVMMVILEFRKQQLQSKQIFTPKTRLYETPDNLQRERIFCFLNPVYFPAFTISWIHWLAHQRRICRFLLISSIAGCIKKNKGKSS